MICGLSVLASRKHHLPRKIWKTAPTGLHNRSPMVFARRKGYGETCLMSIIVSFSTQYHRFVADLGSSFRSKHHEFTVRCVSSHIVFWMSTQRRGSEDTPQFGIEVSLSRKGASLDRLDRKKTVPCIDLNIGWMLLLACRLLVTKIERSLVA